MAEKADSVDGRLPESKTVLKTVPSVINFHIASVVLVNNDEAETVTAELWIRRSKSGSYSRRIIRKYPMPPLSDAQEHGIFIALGSGDVIEGRASIGDKVDYVISFRSEM